MSDFNESWRFVPTEIRRNKDDITKHLLPNSPMMMVSAPLPASSNQDQHISSSHFDFIMSSAADIDQARGINGMRGGGRGGGGYRGAHSHHSNNNNTNTNRGGRGRGSSSNSCRRINNNHNHKSFTKGLRDASTVFAISNGFSVSAPIITPNMMMPNSMMRSDNYRGSSQTQHISQHNTSTDLQRRLYEDVVGATNIYQKEAAEWSVWNSEDNSTIHKNWMNIISYNPNTWHHTYCPITRNSVIAATDGTPPTSTTTSSSSTFGSAIFMKHLIDEVSSLVRFHNLEDINDPANSATTTPTTTTCDGMRYPYGSDRYHDDTARAEKRLVRVLSNAIVKKLQQKQQRHGQTTCSPTNNIMDVVDASTIYKKRPREEDHDGMPNTDELAAQSLFRNFVGNQSNTGHKKKGQGSKGENIHSVAPQTTPDVAEEETSSTSSSSDEDDFIEDLGAIDVEDDSGDLMITQGSVSYKHHQESSAPSSNHQPTLATTQQSDNYEEEHTTSTTSVHDERCSLLNSHIEVLSSRDQYCSPHVKKGGNKHLVYMLYNAASSGAPPGTASGTPSSSNVIAPNTPELTCVHQLLAVHQDDLLGLAMMNIRYALQNVELLTGDALTNNNPFHCLEQVLTALQSNPSSSKTCNNNALFELALRPRLQTAFIRSSDQEDNNIINNAHIRRHFVRYVYFQSLVYLQQQGGTDLTLNEEVTSTNVTTSYYDDVSNVASTYYHYPYSSEYDTTTTAPLPMFSITGDLLEDNDDDDDAEEEGGTSPKGPDVVDGEMHYLYIVRINSPPPTPSIMNTDTINSNITALNSILGSHYSGGGTNNRVVGLEEGVMPALLRPIRVPSSSSSIPSSVSTLTSVVSNSNLEHGHHIFASPASESGLLSHGAFQYYETFEGVPWIGSDISAFPVHLRKVKTHEKGTMGTTTIPVWCYEVFSCQVVKNILREGLVSSAVQLIAMGASVDIFDSNVVTTIAPTDTHHNNNKPSSASLPTVGESFETLQRLATELELVLKKKPSQVTIHKSLLTTISELFKLLTDVDEEIMEQAQKREELQSKFLKLDEECKNSLRLLDERVISVRDHEEGNRARDAEMRPLEDNLKALSKELARPSSDDRADVRDLCKNIRDYFVLNPTSVLQFLNNAYHRSSKAKADISTTSASSSSSELTTPTMTTLKKGHGAIQAGARNLVLTSSNSWAFRIFDPLQSGRLDCIAIRSAIAATCNASAALHDRHHHQTQYHPTTPTTTNMSSILRVLEDLGRVPDIRRNRGSDIPYVVTNK